MAEKKAVLVVSFGTSHMDTCKKNIEAVEGAVAAALPGWETRRAFTSGMILQKLKTSQNLHIDTVAEALRRLVDEGFGTIVVQPTLVMNGEEFDDIAEAAFDFLEEADIRIGAPLLTSTEDYKALAAVLSGAFPRLPETALCLMGHGTAHHADCAYAALDYHFKDMGRDDIFVGTVEGFPDLDTVKRHIGAFAPKRVTLAPLMLVAGDHAVHDMAGDEKDSWKNAFAQAGYEVTCVLRGLGEYEAVRRIYAAHALAASDL